MTPAKGYTEMKDSGIEWVGMIPAHWHIKVLFQLVSQVKSKNKNLSETNLLSLSYGKIKRKNIDDTEGLLPASFDGYNIIENNDIVLRLTDLQNDHTSLRVGRATERGIITSAYITIRPTNSRMSEYLYYLLHSFDIKKGFYGMGSGVRQGLNYDEVKMLKLPLPPLLEQSAIAAYLDTQCAKIDEIIAQAKASIEDYKQWKASVVDECISQALTSSPQVRLKFLMTYIVDCPHETPEYCLDGDYLVIRTADQDYGFLRPDDSMYRLNEAEFHKRSRRLPLEKNDIVYGREGERWGLACLVPESGKYCLGQRIMQFRCKVDRILPHYAMWALNSRHVYLQGIVDTLGSTSPHVNISTIRNYYIPIPPIPEQRRISTYLFERCGAIDAIIKSKQSLIDDLESYKKSLIYEVVTGKRRVC